MHRNTLPKIFRIQIVWFQPKQDLDRIRISFFKNRIESVVKIHYPIISARALRQQRYFAPNISLRRLVLLDKSSPSWLFVLIIKFPMRYVCSSYCARFSNSFNVLQICNSSVFLFSCCESDFCGAQAHICTACDQVVCC